MNSRKSQFRFSGIYQSTGNGTAPVGKKKITKYSFVKEVFLKFYKCSTRWTWFSVVVHVDFHAVLVGTKYSESFPLGMEPEHCCSVKAKLLAGPGLELLSMVRNCFILVFSGGPHSTAKITHKSAFGILTDYDALLSWTGTSKWPMLPKTEDYQTLLTKPSFHCMVRLGSTHFWYQVLILISFSTADSTPSK